MRRSAGLNARGIEDSPAAPANRPGVIPAGAGYGGQRGGTIVYDSGYPLIRWDIDFFKWIPHYR